MAQAQRPSADWTQWRGPNRDGVVASFTAPAGLAGEATQRWKVEVGLGYATPLVVGNRIYMFSRQGENEVMSALDADTGKVLWQTGYPAPFTMHSAAAPHGPGPKSTPVFANGTLYSIGMTGIVTAFDAASGKQLWQKPGSTACRCTPRHAFSPVVDRGLVIFHVGGHDKGALTAFDVDTGEVKWSWAGDGPGYGSPIVADLGGTRQIVTITQGKLVGVDAATGALLWERPFVSANFTNSITPVVYGQTVIVSGNGGPTIAFRPCAKRNNQWVTETVWENADVPLRMSNARDRRRHAVRPVDAQLGSVLRGGRRDRQDAVDVRRRARPATPRSSAAGDIMLQPRGRRRAGGAAEREPRRSSRSSATRWPRRRPGRSRRFRATASSSRTCRR